MRKRNIVLISLIILYLIISLLCNLLASDKKTVYLGSNTKVYLEDGIEIEYEGTTLNSKPINYYFNSKSNDGTISSIGNINSTDYHLEVRNTDGKIVNFNEDIIAYTKNVEINVKNTEDMALTSEDKDMIRSFLSSNGYESDIILSSKTRVDLDEDGKYEEIYTINYGSNYSIMILLNTGDNIVIIDKVEYNDEEETEKNIKLFSFIDFDDDNKYEIVIKENNGDNKPTFYNIYEYVDGSVTELGGA